MPAEAQRHRRATLGPRPRDHGALLRDGQLAHDVQPDPDAAKPPPVAGLALDEPLEDPLVVAGGDADALVFDADLDPRPGLPGGTVASPGGAPAERGVFYRWMPV